MRSGWGYKPIPDAPQAWGGKGNSYTFYMGLTTWAGEKLSKIDVSVAKNYLKQEELDALNKIVTAYLDFPKSRPLINAPCICATGL